MVDHIKPAVISPALILITTDGRYMTDPMVKENGDLFTSIHPSFSALFKRYNTNGMLIMNTGISHNTCLKDSPS